METKVKFGFGTDQLHCETLMFDSIEDLLEYAQASWKEKDGNPFDEDCEYDGSIFIGTIECHKPSDFAPSLENISEQITDNFYNECHIDNETDVRITNKKDAEKVWKEFVEKHFKIPCTHTTHWFGVYDLEKHMWVDKYENFNKYVKE